MGYNEKELQAKLQEEKQQSVVLPTKKDTVGSLLREKREELHLSIETISTDLCIKPQYLTALEEERFNSLPGSAYVIGFIKSYASYLKLDTANIISLYKQESMNSNRETPDLIEDENSLIHDPVINSNHIIIGSVIVFLGIIFVYMINSKDVSETSLQPNDVDVVETLPNEDLNTNDNLEISVNDNISSNTAEDVASSSVDDLNVSEKPVMDYFETKIDSIDMENNDTGNASGLDVVQNFSTTKVDENITPVATVSQTVSEPVADVIETSATVPSHEYGLENKNIARISLRATKRVWIKLKKDGFYKYDKDAGDIGTGETVFETILEPGDVYYVSNEPGLYMTIGNAKGVDIIVDGEVIEPLTDREISRHNVEMDVEKLLNKTAYVRNRKVD